MSQSMRDGSHGAGGDVCRSQEEVLARAREEADRVSRPRRWRLRSVLVDVSAGGPRGRWVAPTRIASGFIVPLPQEVARDVTGYMYAPARALWEPKSRPRPSMNPASPMETYMTGYKLGV